jgi:predicted dehydrogenase
MSVGSVPRIALVGTGGFGAVHLENIERLRLAGLVSFVGCTDLAMPEPQLAGQIAKMGGKFFGHYDDLLSRGRADVVVVSTPPFLHRDMTCAALATGASVLVEKPPAVLLVDLDAMTEAGEGRLCQVGFQTLGSSAIGRISELMGEGVIGAVERVTAVGCWVRDDSYYGRAGWAGRRHVNGDPVGDGALSNPFAHAVMNCLAIAGLGPGVPFSAEAELFRTRSIEVEDTGCLRITASGHPTIAVAVTLCSPKPEPAYIEVTGTRGTIRWWYATDLMEVCADGQPQLAQQHHRADLLENLLDVMLGRSAELICPLQRTRPFVALTQWLAKQDVRLISAAHVIRQEDGHGARNEIPGINEVIDRAARERRLFSEIEPAPSFLLDAGCGPGGS